VAGLEELARERGLPPDATDAAAALLMLAS
jgi:hypothetical protein